MLAAKTVAEITVTGGSSTQRDLVKQAAGFYIDQLFVKKHKYLRDMLVLEFELVKNLFDDEHCKADCLPFEDDDGNMLDYEIRIDSSMNMLALLAGVAHEMVHVKQYATKELCDTRKPTVSKWRGEKINWKKLDYYEHPWEIEAYGREIGLLENFVQKKHYTKTKWYLRDPDYL